MKRVSKLPEERHIEIIEAAERLFFEKGFDATSVSDIVKSINVAQGTFYCYFKTKTDVLQAVAERTVVTFLGQARQIVDRADDNAARQLSELVNLTFHFEPQDLKLMELLHLESNIQLHHKVIQETVARLTPLFQHLLNAGIAQGRFKVTNPVETTTLVMGSLVAAFNQVAQQPASQSTDRLRVALQELLTRVLNAKSGSIKLNW